MEKREGGYTRLIDVGKHCWCKGNVLQNVSRLPHDRGPAKTIQVPVQDGAYEAASDLATLHRQWRDITVVCRKSNPSACCPRGGLWMNQSFDEGFDVQLWRLYSIFPSAVTILFEFPSKLLTQTYPDF